MNAVQIENIIFVQMHISTFKMVLKLNCTSESSGKFVTTLLEPTSSVSISRSKVRPENLYF